MNSQRPLVCAGDQNIRTRAVQDTPPQRLGDIHRNQCMGRLAANLVEKGLPGNTVSIVEADQGDLDEARLFVEQRGKITQVQPSIP